MAEIGTFPFGLPILPVVQRDRAPKRIFVLGVYASAVHARWVDAAGKTLVRALAVAPEPEIFWRGNGAQDILRRVSLPSGAGHLEPAADALNGASGKALDDLFLGPLGVNRDAAWLCDLVPHSCMNPRQAAAVAERYRPLMSTCGLPEPHWPTVPRVLATEPRRAEIAAELQQSGARVLVTLGDQPLRWFAHFLGAKKRLLDYGQAAGEYGRLHPVRFGDREIDLLPLVHPRQAGKLGTHSAAWKSVHESWALNAAPQLLARIPG
jgi:uracil-DNA glycosylase